MPISSGFCDYATIAPSNSLNDLGLAELTRSTPRTIVVSDDTPLAWRMAAGEFSEPEKSVQILYSGQSDLEKLWLTSRAWGQQSFLAIAPARPPLSTSRCRHAIDSVAQPIVHLPCLPARSFVS